MTRPADHSARAAALNIKRSFIVKAPAGSGKTTLLVKRYLSLLSTVNNPEEIIAITFTRKAASEMINRVLSALSLAANQDQDQSNDTELIKCAEQALKRNRKLQWNLLDNPGRIRIQTIDALSQRLVRQMPWSAGFGAAPGLIDDDVSQHYLSAARQAVLSALSDQQYLSQAQNLLLTLDNDFSRVCDLLVAMLARRDQWQALLIQEFSAENSRVDLENNWCQAVEHTLTKCSEKLNSSIKEELLLCARYAADNLESQQSESAICLLKDSDNFPAPVITDIEQWRGLATLLLTKKNNKYQIRSSSPQGVTRTIGFPAEKDGGDNAIKNKFQSLLDEIRKLAIEDELAMILSLPNSAFSEQEWQLLTALVAILKLAVAELTVIFQQQGVCDHIEIATRANLALGEAENPTDLALRLDYQIQHLLVDEFQDTSHTQIELFKGLTAGWQPDDGRTVFFVGDPMQSIYRFREADVGIFLQTFKHGFNSRSLDQLELTENFRCAKTIVDWVNEKFTNIFPANDDQQTAAVKYLSSTAYNCETENSDQVTIHLTDKMSEAKLVCDLIQSLLIKVDKNQEIAVLVRSRKHLDEIVDQLVDNGIDHQGVKLQKLINRSCVQDIYALTKALCHFGDRLSWLAILRAPWCGLDLASLTMIADKADNKTIWQTIMALENDLGPESMIRITRFTDVVRPAIQKLGKEPLHDIVRQTWQALGGADTISVTDKANIHIYLRLLTKIESAGQIKRLDLLDRAVNDLWATTDTGQACVQLMTMHNAKGLEFDTVILPGLYKKPAVDKPRLLIWNEFTVAEKASLLLSPIKVNNQDNRRYDFVRSMEKNVQLEESKRLLYVACTRAARQLHLFVAAKPDAASLQALLQSQIQNEIDNADTKITESKTQNGKPVIYQRLPVDYQPSDLPENLSIIKNLTATDNVVEYQWAGIGSMQIGTLIHEIICKLAEKGTTALANQSDQWRSRLTAMGSEEHNLESSMHRIQQAITNIQQDKRAKWILSASHLDQHNEWQLSSLTGVQLENNVIDRTFIDEQGVRWIIDYKTSSHEGGNIEDFLDSEQHRYQAQLEHYAAVLRLREDNPIKLGLYFPLLTAWREWDYAG